MQRWPARHTAAPLSGGFRAHRIQRLSQAAQNRHCTLAPQRTVDTHEIKLDHYSRKHHRFSTISPPLHHAERHFLTKVFPQNLLGILFKQFKWFRRDETSCGSPAPPRIGSSQRGLAKSCQQVLQGKQARWRGRDKSEIPSFPGSAGVLSSSTEERGRGRPATRTSARSPAPCKTREEFPFLWHERFEVTAGLAGVELSNKSSWPQRGPSPRYYCAGPLLHSSH